MSAVVRKAVFDAVILGVIGAALGFGANAVRGSGAVDISRNYFKVAARGAVAPVSATTDSSPVSGSGAGKSLPDHPYQELTFEQVSEVFLDPQTEMGANVFIDARVLSLYEEGHIPGALHADHYRFFDDHIDEVLARVESAEKIISYCEGGDCEDSIFMCADLVESGVPCDLVYLYPGGWEEWKKNDMPIATGREER